MGVTLGLASVPESVFDTSVRSGRTREKWDASRA